MIRNGKRKNKIIYKKNHKNKKKYNNKKKNNKNNRNNKTNNKNNNNNKNKDNNNNNYYIKKFKVIRIKIVKRNDNKFILFFLFSF